MKQLAITVEDDKIVFWSDYTLTDLHTKTGGKWDKNYRVGPERDRPGAWIYPANPPAARAIWDFFSPILQQNNARISQSFYHLTNVENGGIKSKTKPHDHQIKAFWFAWPLRGSLLNLGMGTGKTKIAIDLAANRNARRVLIVAPKAVLPHWPRQFSTHADPDYNPHFLILNDRLTTDKKAAALAAALQTQSYNKRPLVVLINYESVWREPLASALLKAGFDMVIADESQKIKSAGSKQSKFLAKFGRQDCYRLALTGTALHDKPFDVYAQFRFIDPGVFGTNYQNFRQQYAAYVDEYGNPRPLIKSQPLSAYKNLPEFQKLFYSRALRVRSEDVLDLPPVTMIDYSFELSPAARKLYDQLENTFRAELSSEYAATGEINVKNKLGQLLRFAQLTSGHAQLDSGEKVEIDSGKAELLETILDGLEPTEPVVIGCRFTADLDQVHKTAARLDRASLELSGRKNQLEKWQAGAAPILAVQIQAGGAGIDLTRACQMINYSIGYSLGDYEQWLKRVDRPPQNRPVRVYRLIAVNTVDQTIYDAIGRKSEVIEFVLNSQLPLDNLLSRV